MCRRSNVLLFGQDVTPCPAAAAAAARGRGERPGCSVFLIKLLPGTDTSVNYRSPPMNELIYGRSCLSVWYHYCRIDAESRIAKCESIMSLTM